MTHKGQTALEYLLIVVVAIIVVVAVMIFMQSTSQSIQKGANKSIGGLLERLSGTAQLTPGIIGVFMPIQIIGNLVMADIEFTVLPGYWIGVNPCYEVTNVSQCGDLTCIGTSVTIPAIYLNEDEFTVYDSLAACVAEHPDGAAQCDETTCQGVCIEGACKSCGSSTSKDFCRNCYQHGGIVRSGEAGCWCESKKTFINAWSGNCPAPAACADDSSCGTGVCIGGVCKSCGSSTDKGFCSKCYGKGGEVKSGEAGCWCGTRNRHVNPWLEDCPMSPVSCDFSERPFCTGACPSGQICAIFGSGCRCTTPNCGAAPACSGTGCPPANKCALDSAAGRCTCAPNVTISCEEESIYPMCTGACPLGQECKVFGARCSCAALPPQSSTCDAATPCNAILTGSSPEAYCRKVDGLWGWYTAEEAGDLCNSTDDVGKRAYCENTETICVQEGGAYVPRACSQTAACGTVSIGDSTYTCRNMSGRWLWSESISCPPGSAWDPDACVCEDSGADALSGQYYLSGKYHSMKDVDGTDITYASSQNMRGNGHDAGTLLRQAPSVSEFDGESLRYCDGWTRFNLDVRGDYPETNHIDSIYLHIWARGEGGDERLGYYNAEKSDLPLPGEPGCAFYSPPCWPTLISTGWLPYAPHVKVQDPDIGFKLVANNWSINDDIRRQDLTKFAIKLQDDWPFIISSLEHPSFIIINPDETFPPDEDYDSDGLTNHEELYVYYTDPSNPDTDNDGLDDDQEANGVTNPNLPDTDNDGLPDGQDPNKLNSRYSVHNGDYVITTRVSCNAPGEVIKGDLIIRNGGVFTDDNCDLVMDCASSGGCKIKVERGGRLDVSGSTIRALDFNYVFDINGSAEIDNSNIYGTAGTKPSSPICDEVHGINIYSDDVTISNSYIALSRGGAIYIENSAPQILNNRIFHNYYRDYNGINCYKCSATVRGNTLSALFDYANPDYPEDEVINWESGILCLKKGTCSMVMENNVAYNAVDLYYESNVGLYPQNCPYR